MADLRSHWRHLKPWIRWSIGGLILLLVLSVAWIRLTVAPTPGAFYTPPEPLPTGPPGTLIRSEPLPQNLPEGAIAYRILYLSTDLQGDPIAVSGTVVAPADPSPEPRPVIAWAHGTVGVLPACGLSHTRDPHQQTPLLETMIKEGFVVVSTDYPGLGTPGLHPYMVGEVAAHSVLDSVRAARQLEVNASDQFIVWGASQGGNSSLWTAQLAADYAPELTLLAAAASAPAIDLAGIIRTNQENKSGGVVVAESLYAWSFIYPDADLDDIIKPEHRAHFERIARTCLSTPLAFLTIGGLLTPAQYLSVDVLAVDPWRTLFDQNSSRGPVDVPVLITHGTADSLISIEMTEADVARRCAAGEPVQFVRLPGVEHDARSESALLTVGWIMDRFAGRPWVTTCEG